MKPKWKDKEKKDAKDFKGKLTKNSGNYWSQKGDIKTNTFLIESKQTSKKSYSISKKTWDKLYEEALFSFKLPILSIIIQDLELVILDKKDFLKLVPLKED
jgi:hypothetical protein